MPMYTSRARDESPRPKSAGVGTGTESRLGLLGGDSFLPTPTGAGASRVAWRWSRTAWWSAVRMCPRACQRSSEHATGDYPSRLPHGWNAPCMRVLPASVSYSQGELESPAKPRAAQNLLSLPTTDGNKLLEHEGAAGCRPPY